MDIMSLEDLYEQSLRPVFKDQFRIIHEDNDCVHIILDCGQEDFFFTLYGIDCVHLYWCNEGFIFDCHRNLLVSSDTYGEIVFEGKLDVQGLPNLIIELVMQLKDCTYVSKKEFIKGKTLFGYDDIKDYFIRAKAIRQSKSTYQLANITIEYI